MLLLWLWLTNSALLFGAEFDAELERARELEAGIQAEETLQLPPRDTKVSDKAAKATRRRHRRRSSRLQAPLPTRSGIDQPAGRHADRGVSAMLLLGLAVVLGRSRAARSHVR